MIPDTLDPNNLDHISYDNARIAAEVAELMYPDSEYRIVRDGAEFTCRQALNNRLGTYGEEFRPDQGGQDGANALAYLFSRRENVRIESYYAYGPDAVLYEVSIGNKIFTGGPNLWREICLTIIGAT